MKFKITIEYHVNWMIRIFFELEFFLNIVKPKLDTNIFEPWLQLFFYHYLILNWTFFRS